MSDPRGRAAQAGITIGFADLGDWGASTLISEYDPHGPAIRINERALERYRAAAGALDSCDVRAFVDVAVAHELYHHGEATGAIERLPNSAEREAAADAFARSQVAVAPRLDAFLRARR